MTEKRLRPGLEVPLINLICFGPFMAWSTFEMLSGVRHLVFDDRRMLTVVAIEVAAGVLAALLLRWSGWHLSDFGLRPTMRETLGGSILLFAYSLLGSLVFETVQVITGTDLNSYIKAESHVSWITLAITVLINPLFEELFEVAYNIRALEQHGAAFAISVSAAIRFACHLYHGPIASVTILPLGILYAAVYWRWRRLWPLVFAHAMTDVLGLVST